MVLPGELEDHFLRCLDRAGGGLELMTQPNQRRPPCPITMGKAESMAITSEIGKLSEKGAIKTVQPCVGQFLSQLFLVPKKDGSQRPVINLKPLNLLIQKQKFKMEGAKVIRDLLQRGDWMTSIDLKDAYLSVPVAKEHRKYLRFAWGNTVFEFQCLPFGLSSAPRIFTKLLKPVMALLRKKGIRCIIFLDDLLIMGKVRKELESLSQEIILLLQLLGFRINFEKSHLTPTQTIKYLGFWIDSTKMIISLPEDKVRGIIQACQTAVLKQKLSVRDLARLLGRMSATAMAVLPAPICYRSLQRQRNAAFAIYQSFETQVQLNQASLEELQWWIKQLPQWNGRSIPSPLPDITVETDASLLGWGAAANGTSTGGLWSDEERSQHINHLELMGGAFAIKTFLKGRRNIHARLKMDSTAAISYINHMGGTRSQSLSHKACELWQWCLQRGITLSAEHLPGVMNTAADTESRTVRSSAEWRLNREVFSRITQVLGSCSIDLFASRLNNQLPRYMSWRPDPFAVGTDALQMPWWSERGYAFPPFALIGRCLRKIHQEGCSVILVAPVWVTQPWYPMLLELLVDLPLLLPAFPLLLLDHFNRTHPLLEKGQLQLAAWKLSGDTIQQKVFQQELQISSKLDGVRGPTPYTNQDGTSGIAGVQQGVSIPFHVISTSFWTS